MSDFEMNHLEQLLERKVSGVAVQYLIENHYELALRQLLKNAVAEVRKVLRHESFLLTEKPALLAELSQIRSDPDSIEEVMLRFEDPFQLAMAWTQVAQVTGDKKDLETMFASVQSVLGSIEDPEDRERLLAAVVRVYAPYDEVTARRILDTISLPHWRVIARIELYSSWDEDDLSAVFSDANEKGDLSGIGRARAWGALAEAFYLSGDVFPRRYVNEADFQIMEITDPDLLDERNWLYSRLSLVGSTYMYIKKISPKFKSKEDEFMVEAAIRGCRNTHSAKSLLAGSLENPFLRVRLWMKTYTFTSSGNIDSLESALADARRISMQDPDQLAQRGRAYAAIASEIIGRLRGLGYVAWTYA